MMENLNDEIMSIYAERLQALHAKMDQAAHAAGRNPQAIQLLAVSKAHDAETVRAVYSAGQRAFGENYVQEAIQKQAELQDLAIDWHFIGPIQSNKTQVIAQHFAWVHGVDRLKIAQRLSHARQAIAQPLNICLQVNVSGEASKSGVAPDEVLSLALQVRDLPYLHLRGLMAIPEPTPDITLQARQFARLRELQQTLIQHGFALDTLSMGMSDDFAMAIAEGSTMVRIGSAIFGARPAKQIVLPN